MDIVVKGRRCEVPERFRRHATDKLARLGKLDPKVIRIDVEICKEPNPRLSEVSERVELTCQARGPVIRAEAAAPNMYAALDAAFAKIEMRLRRAADRRRVHRGNRTPVSVAAATAPAATELTPPSIVEQAGGTSPNGQVGTEPTAAVADSAVAADDAGPAVPGAAGVLQADGPFVVREKVHKAVPMTLDQALFEMELVGHDFFLFVDAGSRDPSVVYRRRGYDYGVIRLRAE